jgi:hypothetical protein
MDVVQKLKRLGSYDELLFHSREFASVSKQCQIEILKTMHPDLSDRDAEELCQNIVEDLEMEDE